MLRDHLKEGGKLLELCNREEFLKQAVDKRQQKSAQDSPYGHSLVARATALKHREATAPKELHAAIGRRKRESVLVESTDPRLLE